MKMIANVILICLLGIIHTAASASLEWYPGWRTTTPMNQQRAGAAVLEVNGRIYAIGGVDGIRFLDSVEYTTIKADGTLATWRMTAALNEKRGFFSAVAHKGYIYIAGGGNGPNGSHYLQSVERTKILADGSLGPWVNESSTLTYPRRCAKLVVIGDTLYTLGGFGGTLLDSVESAPIHTDGHLGTWSLETNRMTMPRYINALKKHHSAVYVIGGHDQLEGSGLVDVEYAAINADNALAPWRTTAAMNKPRYALSAAAHGDYIYALGGLHGAIYTDVIEKGIIDKQGAIRTWQLSTSLSSLRANFGTVVYKDRIYIIGGTNRDGYYNSVQTAGFNATGDIGIMATQQEIASFKQAATSSSEKRAMLPNYGIVRQIIHTKLYSYIEVEQESGNQWLAAPRTELQVNDRIRFSRGLTMTNFHSRILQRDFPSIIFVERLEKVSDRVP